MNKLIKYSIILFVGLLVFQACNKDFLDEKQRNTYPPSLVFVSTNGFDAVLTGCYELLRQEWGNYLRLGAGFIGTDACIEGKGSSGSRAYERYGDYLTPSFPYVNAFWDWGYQMIANCNLILGNIDNEGVDWNDASDKARIEAEAKFIRAYAYNRLTNLFGGVPIVEEVAIPFKLDYTRATLDAVLDFVVEDCLFAINNLPEEVAADRQGTAVKGAAQHLLTEVYLRKGDYSAAETLAKSLINNGPFSLVTSRFGVNATESGDYYSDMFIEYNHNGSAGNTESIWVAQLEYDTDGGEPGPIHDRRMFVPYYASVPGMLIHDSLGGRGLGRMVATKFYLGLYEDTDMRNSKYNIRRHWYYNDPTHPDYGKEVEQTEELRQAGKLCPCTRKHDFGVAERGGGTYHAWVAKDRIIYRLGETYLFLAEAQLMQGKVGDATATINIIRARAEATPVTEAEMNEDYLLDERLRELFAEVPRRFTLNRFEKLIERVQLYNPESADKIASYNVLFPIPQPVIDLNIEAVIEQNPGY